MRVLTHPSMEAPMVNPIPPYISPKQRELLEDLTAASRLRAARFPSPKPPPVRRRSRQYPGGRPNPWRVARLRRRHQG
ncbi:MULTISPECIES: hypothetical protein [unclassified Streptomyces]|uniref:hypothetical protein n=1 Tax=unclassified Streptomyces TaxID=2593676 RepID=UPI00382D62CB